MFVFNAGGTLGVAFFFEPGHEAFKQIFVSFFYMVFFPVGRIRLTKSIFQGSSTPFIFASKK
jgi:hypothetical protein